MMIGNKKADKQLAIFANELKNNVSFCTNNDLIYQDLEAIEGFVYKVPRQTVDIFKHILKTSNPIVKTKEKFGVFEGKSRNNLILKGLELLGEIRYIIPNQVLPLLEKVITSEDKAIRDKALEILKKFSKYDYAVIYKSKIGYSAQRTALDYILKWPLKKQLTNIDFALAVIKELLSSSVEGSSWTDEKTLTMNFSHVQPTEFIKKIRKESMNLVYDLYEKTSDPKIRLRLSSVLEEALRGPGNVKYSDELGKMLDDDARYLAGIYRKMIFDESGNLIKENIAVAEEIEERMYYFAKPKKDRTADLAKLRKDIIKDPLYEKVCPMIGGRAAYRGEEGYEESRQRREKDQQAIIAQISDDTLGEWKEIMELLSMQRDIIEEWKLSDFKRFIEMLTIEKPDIADKLMNVAFEKKTNLIYFSEYFLRGLRNIKRFDLWDKYVNLIIKQKSVYLTAGICSSLILYDPTERQNKLRSNEITLLRNIVNKKEKFGFIKLDKDNSYGAYLHSSLLRALCSYSRQHQNEMEKLIEKEIENNPEYTRFYYDILQSVSHSREWLDLSLISKLFRKYLLRKIVEAPDLDWNLQEFLIALCDKNFNCIVDVFKQRIKRADVLQKKDKSRGIKRWMKQKEFEAVPYHLNPDLQSLISNDKNFPKKMHEWIGKMTLGWSTYNWEVSRFLESLKVDRMKVFSGVVENGNDNDLIHVINAMDGIHGADLEFCLKIVGKTDNQKIHRMIGGIIYSIGTVSGEYGIADAYRDRIKSLEAYKKSKNKRIKKFATDMITSLLKSEEDERKRVAEEIQLRKVNFEN